ncbi:hypothetical protein CR513_40755, partial [Mucuna pruriens]
MAIVVEGGSENNIACQCMTRSISDILQELDPEIDRTLRRLRKVRSTVHSSPNINSDFNYGLNKSQEPEQMENNDRTLKELAMPDMLIHLLPKFHGLAGEDPQKHLKEFHVVCSTMRLQGISKDYIKIKAFPFSLDGVAKDWLYLQLVLFNTWGDMKCMFLEKFFPASGTTTIRKEICGIRKHFRETLHEYWERFNKLCVTCLTMMERRLIDAASGGALVDKMPTATRHLIFNMASNT